MTKDDIIRMALEAGFEGFRGEHPVGWGEYAIDTEIIERFADLVAAAEREHIAKEFKNTLKVAEERGAAAEREECAGLEISVTVPTRDYSTMTPLDCYEAGLMDQAMAFRKAIRARGNSEDS